MTAQRQERNRSRSISGFRLGIALIASWAGLMVWASPVWTGSGGLAWLPSAARATTTERVVVNRFTGLAIEGFDPVAYFTDARPELGAGGFRGLGSRRGLALPQRRRPRVICRPSRYLRSPIWRLRPDRPGARGHGCRQSAVLADLRRSGSICSAASRPGTPSPPIPRALCGMRTSAGRSWSRRWLNNRSQLQQVTASGPVIAPPPDRPRR